MDLRQITVLDDCDCSFSDIEPEPAGTMVCWARRYRLGHEQPQCEPSEYKWPKGAVRLPLYLYDHSGLAMNTTGFSCPWDSGQVGYIFATTARLKELMGWKRLTKKRRLRAAALLRGEVERYSLYLQGEVYSLLLEYATDEDCYGAFLGDDVRENGMSECVPEEWLPVLEKAMIERGKPFTLEQEA